MPASVFFNTSELSVDSINSSLSISLLQHQVLLLSGPSGSGKSLLLRAMADLDVHVGQVFLRGVSQTLISPEDWRRQVAYVAAETAWWAATVGAHFLHQPSIDQLQQLGFEADVMGWQVERMSSGERQRLGILRALVISPSILLLDEPTANLDKDNTLAVEALLMDTINQQEVAAVWVSHNAEQRSRIKGEEVVLQ